MPEAYEYPVILRVLVGSHAHDLARPDSDFDYREVFVIPTHEMLSLSHAPLKYAWMTQSRLADDEGGWEIAHFLQLCQKGAPHAVETLFAPLGEDWAPEGSTSNADAGADPLFLARDVRRVGRVLLTRKAVRDAIINYATNSFRKIESNPGKWKAGMLRTLYQGNDLITRGEMSLAVPQDGWGEVVRSALANRMTDGEVLDRAQEVIRGIRSAQSVLPETPDFEQANEWLLRLRRDRW